MQTQNFASGKKIVLAELVINARGTEPNLKNYCYLPYLWDKILLILNNSSC